MRVPVLWGGTRGKDNPAPSRGQNPLGIWGELSFWQYLLMLTLALNCCGWCIHGSVPGQDKWGLEQPGLELSLPMGATRFKGPFQPQPVCDSMISVLLREQISTRFVLLCSSPRNCFYGSSKSFSSSHHGEDSLLPGTDKFLEEELIAANWQLAINDELHAQP